MGGSSQRDRSTVAALIRRIAHNDAAALTNAAWFAARRGELGAARDCAKRAAALPDASPNAHRALALLETDMPLQLLLVLPTVAAGVGAPPGVTAVPVAVRRQQASSTIAEGRALLDAGRVADSLAVFDVLASGERADAAALFHRGVALAKLRRYSDAIRDWHAVDRTDPAGPLAAVSRRFATSARRLADLFTGAG